MEELKFVACIFAWLCGGGCYMVLFVWVCSKIWKIENGYLQAIVFIIAVSFFACTAALPFAYFD